MERVLLLGSCLIALILNGWLIKVLAQINDKWLKVLLEILAFANVIRYVALMIGSDCEAHAILTYLRYFYPVSRISLPILLALSIWRVIPLLKDRMKWYHYGMMISPYWILSSYWVMKWVYNGIRQNERYFEMPLGISLYPYWFWLGLIFGGIMSLLCVGGIIRYKHLQIRTQLLIILCAWLLWVLDSISMSRQVLYLMMPFVLSEAFAMWAVCYAFSKSVKIKCHSYQ